MELTLTTKLTDQETIISAENSPVITVTDTTEVPAFSSDKRLLLLLKNRQFLAVGNPSDLHVSPTPVIEFDQIITVSSSWEDELMYLEQVIFERAKEANSSIKKLSSEITVPKNQHITASKTAEWLTFVLSKFGYNLTQASPVQEKKKPAKTRHKWSKEVSTIEFFVDTRQSKAIVLWQKRNEMLIKKGAIMMPEAPLNKDGSLGFSAKMGQKIRDDHADIFKNFTTTEDLVLKSVNEVGLFLYFAGTNSWLELKDANGKTIEDWTKIDD
ncbi:hypothetical protein BAU15_11620 [Enterococcus sp. JM4C]|uniref:hypothetical protein n=1 Tax=Candidatus Enterococcus huntleyi TaxID=1857217 RepID=UPI0013799B94|nr:hypothetical protein [Enterococcus sp. JM4C]KAF1297389.1 hypothetical protein BAU15_11620 [Enterococcus sp. JM4C]